MRVELAPDQVKALGIPLNRILQAIRDANLDLPAGRIEQGSYDVTLRTPAEFTHLDQIRNTVIFQQDGAAVTLGQVAEVHDTYEKLRRLVRIDGERGIRVAIRKEADANTVEVARQVLAEIEEVNRSYPRVRIIPVINQGNVIERSIANVVQSVFYGGGQAIFVLFFFLRNIRSTLVIFLPLVFVRGVAGILFQKMAYVIIFSLTCSLLVSLSLIPMVASRLLKPRGQQPTRGRAAWLRALSEQAGEVFRKLDTGYRNILR